MQKIQSTELCDLIDVAYALRSIEQDEIERWLIGQNELLHPKLPHPGLVESVRLPVLGVEKHYEITTPENEKYTFVVNPNEDNGVTSNKVALRASRTYPEGMRESGPHVKSDQHEILYLLPWIKDIPLSNVTYENAREFFANNNGFETEIRRPELSVFYDQYSRTKPDGTRETLDCYVRIEPTRLNGQKAVKLSLDVDIPLKKIK